MTSHEYWKHIPPAQKGHGFIERMPASGVFGQSFVCGVGAIIATFFLIAIVQLVIKLGGVGVSPTILGGWRSPSWGVSWGGCFTKKNFLPNWAGCWR
mgnify:CR=1 FL=1